MTDRLDALAEAATPGNWSYFIDDYGEGDRPGTMFITADPKGGQGYLAADLNQPDAAFIVALVNAYPELAAAIRELRAAIDNLLRDYENDRLLTREDVLRDLRHLAALHREDGA